MGLFMFLSNVIATQRSLTTTLTVTGSINGSGADLVILSILSALERNSGNLGDPRKHLLKDSYCNFNIASLEKVYDFFFQPFPGF